MSTRNYEGIKFDSGAINQTNDSLTIEEALQINVNSIPFTITMRTPGDDENLVRGLLNSEGVVREKTFQVEIKLTQDKEGGMTIANVDIPQNQIAKGYSNSRSLLSVASCGICGKTELEDLTENCDSILDTISINPMTLQSMFNHMGNDQNAFKQSGGSHAAAGFDSNGDMICAFEDIGRHNAVDKVIGYLIRNNQLNKCVCLTVSGRISYEIVVKSFKSRIPILASVSAPSSLAVDYAKELGITLLSFCRDTRATCYANTQRITNSTLKNQAG